MTFVAEPPTSNWCRFSILDTTFIAVWEKSPDLIDMNQDWFDDTFIDVDFLKVDIVLVSDPRSYFIAEFISKNKNFKGIILMTNSVFRAGRLLHAESMTFQLILQNPIPPASALCINPLEYLQVFPHKELAFIPVPNGTGLGSSNWIVTKNIDPDLVGFRLFIISGYRLPADVYLEPFTPTNVNTVIVLPSASPIDPSNGQSLDRDATLVSFTDALKRCMIENRNVIVPTYTDDHLYSLITLMRSSYGISNPIYISSYIFKRILNLIEAMPIKIPFKLPDNCYISPDVFPQFSSPCIIFAPEPYLKAGQVTKLVMQPPGASCKVLSIHIERGNLPFYPIPDSSNFSSILRFIREIQPVETVSPAGMNILHSNVFPYSIQINPDIIRWSDSVDINRMREENLFKNSGLVGVKGYFECEQAVFIQNSTHYTLNPPSMMQLATSLYQTGATSVEKQGNKLTCEFGFLNGSSCATIDFSNDEIEIEASSWEIEDVIIKLLGMNT